MLSCKRWLCWAAALLTACEPENQAATERHPLAPATATPPPAPAALAAPATARPLAGADTVAPGSIRLNGLPLIVHRAALRQQLGPPDSTYTAPSPAPDSLYCFGDAQLPEGYSFERYGAACYWQRGDTLTFAQTRRSGGRLQVDIGPHRLTERTTLAELARLFPASYRHARQRAGPGRQLLLLFPPAATAPDTWYTLVVENGRLTQFFHVFNCTYD